MKKCPVSKEISGKRCFPLIFVRYIVILSQIPADFVKNNPILSGGRISEFVLY